MKKFQYWFNGLTSAQQKRVLVMFCLVFGALLLLSIRFQGLTLDGGQIQQPHIITDSLKNK